MPWVWLMPWPLHHRFGGHVLMTFCVLQVDLYLQQLQELELLFSEAQAGGGVMDEELERKMQLAEETLQAILGEALSLQGTTQGLPSDRAGGVGREGAASGGASVERTFVS